MVLCVILLICGPFAALVYVPLVTRDRQLHFATVRRHHRTVVDPPSAKGLNALKWSQDAEEHLRILKQAK